MVMKCHHHYYYFTTLLLLLLITASHFTGAAAAGSSTQPDFAVPLNNVSVALGRDATFACVVTQLGGYRVGWVKADTKAIQAIHNHVITHNSRVHVTHSDRNTWLLHIKGVQEEDRGPYMCQINTDPMRSQIGHLEVTVPPEIIDSESSSGDVMVPEGGSVSLRCTAKGHPIPVVVWQREDLRPINIRQVKDVRHPAKTMKVVNNKNMKKMMHRNGDHYDNDRYLQRDSGSFLKDSDSFQRDSESINEDGSLTKMNENIANVYDELLQREGARKMYNGTLFLQEQKDSSSSSILFLNDINSTRNNINSRLLSQNLQQQKNIILQKFAQEMDQPILSKLMTHQSESYGTTSSAKYHHLINTNTVITNNNRNTNFLKKNKSTTNTNKFIVKNNNKLINNNNQEINKKQYRQEQEVTAAALSFSSSSGRVKSATYMGPVLHLPQVTRSDMGPYLCIANNSVPPIVSKRIMLEVHFPPVIHVPNQLISAKEGAKLVLECNVEASPRSIQYWTNEQGEMLITTDDILVQEDLSNYYNTKMALTIKRFKPKYEGKYHCTAKNSLGDITSQISVYMVKPVTTTSTTQVASYTPPHHRTTKNNHHHNNQDIGNENSVYGNNGHLYRNRGENTFGTTNDGVEENGNIFYGRGREYGRPNQNNDAANNNNGGHYFDRNNNNRETTRYFLPPNTEDDQQKTTDTSNNSSYSGGLKQFQIYLIVLNAVLVLVPSSLKFT